MAHDHVDLDLPLNARFAGTVRAVAASIAASIGLTVDEIDDLRLGVNEAVSVLTDLDVDGVDRARLRLRFEVHPTEIVVVAWRHGADGAPVPELDVLARRIMDAVVDDHDIDESGEIRLRKRVSADAEA
mgnify:CR=1 FL=1